MTFVQFPAAGGCFLQSLPFYTKKPDLMPQLRLASLCVVKERATNPGLASNHFFCDFEDTRTKVSAGMTATARWNGMYMYNGQSRAR